MMKSYTSTELLEMIEAYLQQLSYARPPKGLYDPIAYELSLGGKRVRPVLMLMAYNLYKENVASILPQAAGLETYHNHTLLHDDLMDHAEMRRGKPTVHKKWDANTAILSGDAMLILAYRLMADCPPNYLKEVLEVFTETTMEICEGQQWDMEFESRTDVTVEEYIEMIRLKTSVLLAAALKIGALLADAPVEDADKLYDFGVKMGLAFQLQDDWLDVYGDPKIFGKKLGGDILCNKKTYLLITALKQASPEQQDALEAWLVADDAVPADKIAGVTRLYNEIGVGESCEQIATSYYKEGLAILDGVSLPEERKAVLRSFACSLMNRKV